MSITEVLQLMDHLVSKHTGNPLDDLQRRAILGILQHQTYSDIAEGINYDEEYIGKISRELYSIVSQELKDLGQEADVKKSNFSTSIERLINSGNHYFLQNINHIHGNLYVNTTQNLPQNSNYLKSSYQDLTFAPKILKFYNRETELQTLSNWIFNQNTPLISVLGLSGIGKSYLVRRFIDLNLEQFEVIIWRSLKYPESLDLLIDDLLNISQKQIKPNNHNKLKQLFDIFREKRCLIILDDVENIFITGEFAGQYQSQYQDYQNFFTRIIETEHQSHVIVISQEKCKEMECLDEELYPVKCLELSGLDSREILINMGLKNEESWSNLINLYEGNPFYLKTIANSIKNIYDGYIGEFLADNELVIPKDIQTNLQLLFNRLSPIEQQIVIKLSDSEQLVSREDLKTSLNLSSTDLINSLESLQDRYLVTKVTGDKIRFKLSNVFKQYIKNCSKNSC
ncbi:ATP-binding protein [Planktothrix mougeotii]|uniref:ATP-binding protein n=1 Tax=Planktothrix mougeotii LEGE 06226 TaxID=1828728 RepID=A0ABR9UGS7_9CYAN|nr:ATP-binding protein [Planktothrix mougeotii]MBE9145670.1 ATP-binding protein [Planktothrix mougeotii LEGE 06226]